MMTDWQRVVSEHSDAVRQTAWRLVGNEADAADCLQEAFMAAVKVSRNRRVRNWRGLLKVLATRRALDKLRSRIRQSARSSSLADWSAVASPAPGPVQTAEAAELAARLRLALPQLSPAQAEVFCLRHLDDLSYRQIAGQLDIKMSAVGVLLHRARTRLREILTGAPTASSREVLQ